MSAQPVALRPWERFLGHVGYTAEGGIYLLLGLFALIAVAERKRQPNGSVGAMGELAGTTMGKVLLGLLALGLAAFVLWQVLLAFLDPELPGIRPGWRPARRAGHLFTAVLYGGLVGQALWRVLGMKNEPDAQLQARWTSWIVHIPPGRVLVAAVGAGIVAFGCTQLYRALTHDKTKRVDLSHTRLRILIEILGVYGLISRGVLFVLVGGYVMTGAWRLDAQYARGVTGALTALQARPYGASLITVMAAGLISFGSFQILKERFRCFGDR